MSESKLITIKEAASMLGVTTLTLRNWDKNGKLIPSRHPLNNYRVYKRADIDNLIEEIGRNTTPIDTRRKKVTKKLEIKHL
ncbi:MAG: MerR family DNA-binding transcriptional regulator [Candidatus Taylorbacteria bacterium]|nr:MerR family DNA-binding transcriptional regulator [Candidatus Taylorbacteria bacterium]